jgi:hypothetical protein
MLYNNNNKKQIITLAASTVKLVLCVAVLKDAII